MTIKLHSQWLLKLVHHFFIKTPYRFTLNIITELFGQVFSMLSLLLPIKIIMLLGAGSSISIDFPYLNLLSKNQLILSLVVLSCICYLMTFLLNKLSLSNAKLTIEHQLQISKKSKLVKLYPKLIECLSSLFFILLCMLVIFYIYTKLALAISILFASSILFLITYTNINKHSHISKVNPKIFLNITNGFFFLSFLYIVTDYLYFAPPIFVISLISLILTRLMFAKLSLCLSNIVSILKNRNLFDRLLFSTKKEPNLPTIWDLLDSNQRLNWLPPLIEQVTNQKKVLFKSNLIPFRSKGIFFIEVMLVDSSQKVIIKLFDKPFTKLADREAGILSIEDLNLPVPKLILKGQVFSYRYNILDISGYQFCNDNSAKEFFLSSMNSFYFDNSINKNLPKLNLILWEGLNYDSINRLKLFQGETTQKSLNNIILNLDKFKKILKLYPLNIVCPFDNQYALRNTNGKIIYIDWTNWKFKPAGYNEVNSKESIPTILLNSTNDKYLINIVNLFIHLELSLQSHDYQSALTISDNLSKSLETLPELKTIEFKI